MKMTRGQQIEEMAARVMNDKGEGIILRRPASYYFHGRSHDLIKLKTSRGDQEALVVEVLDDGDTFELLLPDGQTFKAYNQLQQRGEKDKEREKEEKIRRGEVVTFTYDTYSRRALPMNVVVLRSRFDLSWEDVLHNFENDTKNLDQSEGHTNKPMGYWYSKKENNVRRFFEEYAQSNGFDPLVPDNWYSVSRQSVLDTKKSASVLERFNGSMIKALIHSFPDIEFDPSRFDSISKKYWSNVDNRRKFFVDYAAKHNFDPFVAENWYTISRDDIISQKGGGTLVKYYGGSAIHALMHLFPDIGLVSSLFPILPKHYWEDHSNRRKFFDDLAKEKGFDPLLANNWYNLPPDSMFTTKEATSLLAHYSNNYVKAIIHAYPELSLDQSKFHFLPTQHWLDARNRRKFFETFARQHSFDPLDPEGWYQNISSERLFSTKWGRIVLDYYKGNYAKALVQLFPEVNFDLSKLPTVPRNFWSMPENRKQFFENVAKSHSFDPLSLEHWYKLGRDSLMKTKGASAVLSYYNGSYITALLDLFPSLGSSSHRDLFTTRSYWRHVANRRNFFLEIAQERCFDPLIATNWYSCPPHAILGKKGIQSVLSYHSGSYEQALQQLFPEINYDPKKLSSVSTNRRKFFEEIAHSFGLDPLIPDHWYSIPADSILNFKGANSAIFFHKRSVSNALLQLFPEIGLDKQKLAAVSKNYWLNIENRRRFFIKFATLCKFDPLVPDNWYSVSKNVFLSQQGASAVLAFYEGNLSKGLQECFSVQFNPDNFKYFPHNKDINSKRDTFTTMATTSGFDSLLPENWYSFNSFAKYKNAAIIIKNQYQGNVVDALMDIFPDIGLNKSKLMASRKNWKDINYRRSFFIDLAKKNNFDPLDPHNWYSLPTAEFLSAKGSSSILSFHQGSFSKALINLFPEVTFDPWKFT